MNPLTFDLREPPPPSPVPVQMTEVWDDNREILGEIVAALIAPGEFLAAVLEGKAVPTTTHMAGPFVVIDLRLIQRCMVCGYKLLDMRLDRIASPEKPDGTPPDPPGTWKAESLVRVSEAGGVCRQTLVSDDGRTLPKDHCLPLVE